MGIHLSVHFAIKCTRVHFCARTPHDALLCTAMHHVAPTVNCIALVFCTPAACSTANYHLSWPVFESFHVRYWPIFFKTHITILYASLFRQKQAVIFIHVQFLNFASIKFIPQWLHIFDFVTNVADMSMHILRFQIDYVSLLFKIVRLNWNFLKTMLCKTDKAMQWTVLQHWLMHLGYDGNRNLTVP